MSIHVLANFKKFDHDWSRLQVKQDQVALSNELFDEEIVM